MCGLLKKKTTTFRFLSLTSYVSFFYPVLLEVFPEFASFGVVHFFRFIFRASVFPLLHFSSLCRGEIRKVIFTEYM